MKKLLFLASIFISASVFSQNSRVTNAPNTVYGKDYGMVADGVTNNYAAWARMITDITAKGGGICQLPYGVIKGDSFPIPAVLGANYITIRIQGEGFPLFYFGTVGTGTLPTRGSILQSSSTTSGSAVLKVDALNGPTFSAINLEVVNLEIRTYDNPQINGIDAGYASFFRAANVFVNTGIYNPQSAQPGYNVSGIVTPRIDNGALTILDNVTIASYYHGITDNEHTKGSFINVLSCVNGINFQAANHDSHYSRLGSYSNTYPIYVTGFHRFTISDIDIEHAVTPTAPAYQVTISDIKDSANNGRGEITYSVVKMGVGSAWDFSKSGGDSVACHIMGRPPWDVNVSTREIKTSYVINSPTFNTQAAQAIFGGFTIQPYSADNFIFGSNIYYNTTAANFKYVASAAAEAVNMGGAKIYFDVFRTGTAGGTPAVGGTFTPLVIDSLGLNVTGNVTLGTAGNKMVITEGTNGSVGQTTLVSGTKAITISGLTTSSRAFTGFVAQGGTSTGVYMYKAVCTTNTLTITAIDWTGATVTTDTSVLNYFVIN